MKPLLVGGATTPQGLWRQMKSYSKILEVPEAKFVYDFQWTYLCSKRWDLEEAKEYVKKLYVKCPGPYILLGLKVCKAFHFPYQPFSLQMSIPPMMRDVYILPPPSSRLWSKSENVFLAKELLKEFL